MAKAKKKTYDGSTPLKSILQEAFVTNLLTKLNQTDAYRNAGYKAKKPDRAANQLMRNNKVVARVAYKRAVLAKLTDVTAERVIKELAKIGFSDIRDYLGTDNEIGDISTLEPELTAAVESVQSDIRHDSGDSRGYTEKVKLKLHSKLSALDMLAKHLGLFEADNTQRNTGDTFIVTFIDAEKKETARQVESEVVNDSG